MLKITQYLPLLLTLFLLIGCTSASNSQTNEPEIPLEKEKPTAPAEETSPELAKICSSDFARGKAKITIWQDETATNALFVLQPDINAFSHPPTLFYDAEGNEVLAVANRPVEPGDTETEQNREAIQQLQTGLSKSETVFCSDFR